MVGVEIDMVVSDSLKALELYEKVFEIERIEVTDFPKGENEVVFSLYGVRFHMLDENPKFGLKAPNLGDPQTIWFNILVSNIKEVFSKAINEGCTVVQELLKCLITECQMLNLTIHSAIIGYYIKYIKKWVLKNVQKCGREREKTNHS